MQGTFYGVGVGPWDPDLMTLKAVKILREADVVIAPRADIQRGHWTTCMVGYSLHNHGQYFTFAGYKRPVGNICWC